MGASAPTILRFYMIGVVLGNGPSQELYDKSGDLIVGCNIPKHKVDLTVICDVEVVYLLKKDLTLIQVPVIISTMVYEKMKELRIVDSFDIRKVFKPKDWYNAAHYADDFLREQNCDEIHIWGCDSIFNDDVSSTTDKQIPKTMDSERFLRNWRKVWDKKFEDRIQYIIHRNTK